MSLRFTKMAGCGNDFVVVDARRVPAGVSFVDLGRTLCRHGTGIGADGLVVLDSAASGEASYSATIINRSGLPAEMCGNAARCLARFAADRAIAGLQHAFRTPAGIIRAEVSETAVSIALPQPSSLRRDREVNLNGDTHRLDVIDVGVPHAVLWWKDVAGAPVAMLGNAIRHAPTFPQGVNVNFAENAGARLRVRTFERGVEAETLACGTGAVAAAIAAAAHGYLAPPVEVVTTEGGILRVDFRLEGDQACAVMLSGPTIYVFEGELSDEWLAANLTKNNIVRT